MSDQDKRLKELAEAWHYASDHGEPWQEQAARYSFVAEVRGREDCYSLLSVYVLRLDAAERRVKELEAQTELHKRWHKKPAHGRCCICQRCGLDYDTCRCVLDECADELELLKVRCQELEKDRERLDWLLDQGASVGSYTEGRDWCLFDNSGALMSVAWQPTPRQVIDAAREREGES